MTAAGFYLLAYELVMNEVVDGVRSLVTSDDRYAQEVRSRARYEFAACMKWLVEQGALTEADATAGLRLMTERNRVAHELSSLLLDPAFSLDPEVVADAGLILQRLATFFGSVESDASRLYAHVLEAVQHLLGPPTMAGP